MARRAQVAYHASMNDALTTNVRRIVSGGQTGVDQGALAAAIWLGLEHGGWCPKGRRSEAGPIPPEFQLQESHSAKYSVRTEQNVRDSDGTMILYRAEMTGGTAFTRGIAAKRAMPVLSVDFDEPIDLDSIRDWIVSREIRVLNVAGPRESSQPGIGDDARKLLVKLLGGG